ncbi:MBOAT family protein [uncultured Phocaeicola sp.]|uniref:MBOAT family O-acyltransferase n=1 Tax=uncultured Phocaeicola sp. TaxID=990718 RepID=UPI001434C98A|nr:MBOAT family protein [uncultured Phocaeicola sp.]GFI00281.1 peptidoglycan O-acetyltransferase [Bacteroidaceae bacterium]
MLFNSFEFLVFLPIVFLLYWLVFKSLRWQNLFVVAASYLFYGWWDWCFLILIAITTFCSFASGVWLEKCEGQRVRQKWISASNILLNLVILCIFKYYNFFGENLAELFSAFGMQLDWVTLDILLPVGISFYTFQALSYTIDVYQHKIKPTRDVVAFFAFISFFPQLVAGPIERATHLLPQFLAPRTFSYEKAVDGMRQILWGLFKKMVVADNCAVAVNLIFDEYQTLDGFSLFLGAVFFTFQIYGDFSGYSDIAIGTARLFGIQLMRNFNFPYFSRDIAEFWRKWHISLTTWFRDYIYIPLGGSRCGKWKVARNTLIIFLVSGFWHGANWTFICWGAFHALLFFPLFMLGKNRKYQDVVAKGRLLPSVKEACQMVFTFLLAVVGWIIFRAETMRQAWNYMICMVTKFHICMPEYGKKTLVYIFILLIVEWLQREKQFGLQLELKGMFRYRTVRWGIYYLLFIVSLVLAGQQEEFIYFQF